MATSIDDFKQAFAGKAAGDDIAGYDKRFAGALKRLDQSIEALGGDAAADGFRSARETLIGLYREARGQSGRSSKEIASQLDGIVSRTETLVARAAAVPAGLAGAAPAPTATTKAAPAPPDSEWSISPDGEAKPKVPDFSNPDLGIPRIDPEYFQQLEKERKQREKDAEEACRQARKWLAGRSLDELRKLSYPAILATIKEKFPAVSELPKPKTLMDMIDSVLHKNGYLAEKGPLGDPAKLAMEKLIAGYIAALPASIQAIVGMDGGLTLVTTGSGGASTGGKDEKSGDQKSQTFDFKNKDIIIQVANEAWKALDPAMRAQWKGLNDEATTLEKLWDKLTSLKKEWESAKDGSSSKVELEARIKDLEAEFKGKWETLQQSIDATAKLTTDGLKASITEAKKKIKDDKVGAELELKFSEMSVAVKAFANTPDLKTALTITGSAEKITAKIEAEAIKSGTVVTLAYEKALKEVKEQLELQIKQDKSSIAVTLSKEAVKLEDQLKKLKDAKSKDFKDVTALESGLEKLQLEVKAKFTSGQFTVSAGGKAVSGGEVGGTVKVEMMLRDGISFFGKGQKISFSADVSNTGYKFALMFSVGEMPDLKEVESANKEADDKIKELYKLVQDERIRSMDDAKKIEEALSAVLKPLKKSVDSMKKIDKKKVAAEFGITVTGELPNGGNMPPPVFGFGLKVTF
jgi:hypothetical protein